MFSRRRPRAPVNNKHESVTLRAATRSGRYQIAATVIGVLLTAGSGYAVWLLTQSHSASSESGSSSIRSAEQSSNQPVKIEQVSQIYTGPNYSFVVPGKLQLTSAQLSDLNQRERTSSTYLGTFETAHHSVALTSGYISATLMGNEPRTITITSLEVIKSCQPPLAGTFFFTPSAGESNTISLGFDLDSQDLYAQNTIAGRTYSGNFFQDHVITLTQGETHTLAIYVTSYHYYCKFSFRMTVATPKGVLTESIMNGRRPFQLTAFAGSSDVDTGAMNLSAYRAVYVGGLADTQNDANWIEVNPATYNGLGNPASFPPTTSH